MLKIIESDLKKFMQCFHQNDKKKKVKCMKVNTAVIRLSRKMICETFFSFNLKLYDIFRT